MEFPRRAGIIWFSIMGVVLAVVIFLCSIPSSDDGRVPVPSIDYIGELTQEQIRSLLLERSRTAVRTAWGQPEDAGGAPPAETYRFEDVPYTIVLQYDADERVTDISFGS